MLRQARAIRSLLLRVQAERSKREADSVAPRTPIEEPPPEEKPAASTADILAEAERYALSHHAALIRTLGCLPDRLNCGPPPPELVRVIATGNNPVLR